MGENNLCVATYLHRLLVEIERREGIEEEGAREEDKDKKIERGESYTEKGGGRKFSDEIA